MKLRYVFTLFTVSSILSVAQNLVSNPGFETAIRKPEKRANSINRAKGWIAPSGNSDYYMKGAHRSVSTPRNVFGRQKPHGGKAYAGICTRTSFMEYVETRLNAPLEKDRDYLVEFYISRAERSLGAVKNFGVLFTAKKIMGINGKGIQTTPQISFERPRGYRKKKKWIKLSAVYKADGSEVFLTIGYFPPHGRKRRFFSHYYIDDVLVRPLETATDSLEKVPILSDTVKAEPLPEPQKGQRMVLHNVFFEPNRSALLPASFPALDPLALYLIKHPGTYLELSGHTDNTGQAAKNQRLSEDRAKAVADYLITKGVEAFRMRAIGYGSSAPVVSNDTEEGRQQNRRVEFMILEK